MIILIALGVLCETIASILGGRQFCDVYELSYQLKKAVKIKS